MYKSIRTDGNPQDFFSSLYLLLKLCAYTLRHAAHVSALPRAQRLARTHGAQSGTYGYRLTRHGLCGERIPRIRSTHFVQPVRCFCKGHTVSECLIFGEVLYPPLLLVNNTRPSKWAGSTQRARRPPRTSLRYPLSENWDLSRLGIRPETLDERMHEFTWNTGVSRPTRSHLIQIPQVRYHEAM